MTFHHFVVTLTAAAAPITTSKTAKGFSIRLQSDAANTHAVYVGGLNSTASQTVSSSDYGVRLPPPSAAGDPAPPFPFDPWNQGISLPLNQIVVFGTTGEKVAVSYWTPD